MPDGIDWRKGTVCGIDRCKATYYREEAGWTWCRRGHQQEAFQTQPDEDDFGTQGQKTRIRQETAEKVSHIYRGQSATTLYLQAYQLILWKQCYALIHTIGLPAELEVVVKDLWSLRLQLLHSKTDATSDDDTLFSSQPQTETDTEREGEDAPTKEYKVKGKAMPTLIETLSLCYLGCVLLRLPISMGDVHRWAVREDVPFIRSVRFVPIVMKQKLPAEYLNALDTTSPLEPDHLRKAIHNLSLFYTHHFKLVFPPLNIPLLLYKYIRDLALPIPLHPITLQIARLLSIAFNFPTPGLRQRLSSLPELQLISLLVIATKVYHPFDSLSRHARSLADPAALTTDWPAWVEAHATHDASLTRKGHLPPGSEIHVTEADVMKMTGDEMDQYMDYYERTFIDKERVESKSRGLPNELLDMFPTTRANGPPTPQYSYRDQVEKEQTAADQLLKTVVGAMKTRPVVAVDSKEPVRRVGDFYKRYRRVEDLEGVARVFYERVAAAVGIKVQTLVLAVGQLERRLMVWREARVREEEGEEEEEESAGDEKESIRDEERRGKGKGKGRGDGEDVDMGDEGRRGKEKEKEKEKGRGDGEDDVDMGDQSEGDDEATSGDE